jgi:pimeloyl-ACP methyl ester carboxylesterase
MEWFLPAFAQWFDAMDLRDQPVILVGHSMGAMLATEWAIRNPSTVRLLVMISAAVYNSISG